MVAKKLKSAHFPELISQLFMPMSGEEYLRDLTAKVSEIASIFQAERTLVMGWLGCKTLQHLRASHASCALMSKVPEPPMVLPF